MLELPEYPDREVTRTITCPDTDVVYMIIERKDITDIQAPGYLFQFTRHDDAKPDEYKEFILSHEDVESAIEWFGAKHYRFDAYANARFTVERMGIDFVPYRKNPLVLGIK